MCEGDWEQKVHICAFPYSVFFLLHLQHRECVCVHALINVWHCGFGCAQEYMFSKLKGRQTSQGSRTDGGGRAFHTCSAQIRHIYLGLASHCLLLCALELLVLLPQVFPSWGGWACFKMHNQNRTTTIFSFLIPPLIINHSTGQNAQKLVHVERIPEYFQEQIFITKSSESETIIAS